LMSSLFEKYNCSALHITKYTFSIKIIKKMLSILLISTKKESFFLIFSNLKL
jgi:hypothetical protein